MIGAKTEGFLSFRRTPYVKRNIIDFYTPFFPVWLKFMIDSCLSMITDLYLPKSDECLAMSTPQKQAVGHRHPVSSGPVFVGFGNLQTWNHQPFFWWYGGFRVSINGGTPSLLDGWFPWENPTEMDDDWGYLHLWKPPYDYPTFFMKQTSVPFREPLFRW